MGANHVAVTGASYAGGLTGVMEYSYSETNHPTVNTCVSLASHTPRFEPQSLLELLPALLSSVLSATFDASQILPCVPCSQKPFLSPPHLLAPSGQIMTSNSSWGSYTVSTYKLSAIKLDKALKKLWGEEHDFRQHIQVSHIASNEPDH